MSAVDPIFNSAHQTSVLRITVVQYFVVSLVIDRKRERKTFLLHAN